MVDRAAINGIVKQIENTVKMAPRRVTPEILERFKYFSNSVNSKTVTYDLCNEISKLCKDIRQPTTEARKEKKASVRNRRKSVAGNKKE